MKEHVVSTHGPDVAFIDAVIDKLHRAREKFPSPVCMLAAIMEEAGEVAKAMLDQSPERLREECVQVAVTAMRLATEGEGVIMSAPIAYQEFKASKERIHAPTGITVNRLYDGLNRLNATAWSKVQAVWRTKNNNV